MLLGKTTLNLTSASPIFFFQTNERLTRAKLIPFAFASYVVQVSPTIISISECKAPFFHEITLTPTIPVRGIFVSVTFYLPKDLWLVNKTKCSVQLEGTNSVTVKVGATCTTLYGQKWNGVITPEITKPTESEFWDSYGDLATISVCICEYCIIECLENLLKQLDSLNIEFHLLGDINFNLAATLCDNDTCILVSTSKLNVYGLHELINEPTRIMYFLMDCA